ncbi:MAG: hypothetical protein WCP09_02240 [Candidatus Taylorbacteria bacterium]
MTKAIVDTIKVTNNYRTQMTYVLIGGCFLMIAIYVFNVFRVISSTVALQKVQNQTASLESNVENLDAKYLQLSSEITPDTLADHGFVAGKVSDYISRNVSLGSVATGGHEL